MLNNNKYVETMSLVHENPVLLFGTLIQYNITIGDNKIT